jgi:hypothetical protein
MLRLMGARFAGRCVVCKQRFSKGEYIAYDTVARKALHADCRDEYAAVEAPVPAGYDDDGDIAADRAERAAMDREYHLGVARGEHIRQTRDMFGEEAALAEELAWELKDPDPYY